MSKGRLIAAGIVVAVLAAGGVVAVLRGGGERDAGGDFGVGDAVAGIAGSRGTHVELTFGDRNGTLVDASFTVAASGLGSGTVTDPGGGRAEVRTNGTRTVVRGDADWWSRRAPAQASALADKWILPKDGTILPIDIGRALTPKGLAESVRIAAAGAPKATGSLPWPGPAGDVDVLDNGDWLLAVARTRPASVVWFGGHLTGFGPLQPARLDASPAFVVARQPNTVPPYVGVALSTPDDNELARVTKAVDEVFGADRQPATQATVKLTAPKFSVRSEDGGCGGGQCSWTAVVTNTGTAPCDVTVIASVNPGMEPRSVHLGELAPNASKTTPVMTFRTTAARPASNAQVYCPALDGLDPGARQRVAALQFDPSLSTKVSGLDPALQAVMLDAADVLTRGRAGLTPQDRERFLAALELTIAGQLIPEVRAITESGRVENPDALVELLRNASGAAPAADQLAYRRELELAASLLRNDPGARLRLDERAPALTDTAARRVYRLGSVAGDRLLPDRPEAAPGLATVLMVYLEPTRPEHDLDRPGFARLLHQPKYAISASTVLCPGGKPSVDELVLVNRHGEQRWTSTQFHELSDACP
ncbi:hypothetical protein [Dactylosporangium sp. CA-233914]|uniref:hypothetical protein n=1 Tax=Dactylosporangium sp. CA-233914 TaxID=3239934 RepID=UPI003D8B4446